MIRRCLSVLLTLASVSTAACVSGDRRSGDGPEADGGTWCSGTWRCDSGDEQWDVEVAPVADACAFGGLHLKEGGDVAVPGDPDLESQGPTWVTDGSRVAICIGEACMVCTPPSPDAGGDPDDDTDPHGECTGSPRSCSSLYPGSCSSVDGCYLDIGWSSSSSDDYCGGSPASCSSRYSEASCARQGCTWNE